MRLSNFFRRFVSLLAVLCLLFTAASCSDTNVSNEFYSPYEHDFGRIVQAEIVFRDYGTVKVNLLPDEAPITVQNFVDLANSGFYDGLTIHRVVAGFVIQGGDPTGTGYGLEGQTKIKGEFSENGVQNRISHVRGVLSMARTGDNMNSATSQFFIMLEDREQEGYLNGNYAAFGYVSEGMDVVDAIAAVEIADGTDHPVDSIVIESVRILSE
ncbi:MAG: peptidylprolyl isomerase [Eubacteriales bacterium]